jgi:NAD(P)-dependent dehydrogenase (short-subunit alcohol dehydrogenase family)
MAPESLEGRVVLVTGSGCGLGASIARAAAARKARVVVNCRKDADRAGALAAELKQAGAEALALRADVTDHEEARGLVEGALQAFGRVDVLLNTVGSFLWKPVADMEPREWRGTMASNLDSVFNMCRLVLPSMRLHHFGRIVNLGAVGAERTLGQPEVAAYSAAKAAVIAFSKALALEEARRGITVNVICPGAFVDGAGEAPATSLTERVPVGRAGTHDDIVRAALFFACPAADFLTGQVLAVSGGAGI